MTANFIRLACTLTVLGNKEDLTFLAPANNGIIIIAPEAFVAFFKKDRRCWLL
jgi:hypothetical protein